MARLATTASDKEKSALETTAEVIQNIVITTSPVVITAVQRKANIGNFETIDIYMAIAIPQNDLDITDKETLEQALSAAAEQGFALVAKETASRYHLVKDSLKKERT